MAEAEITFQLSGYWHAGSGTGSGASLDALVIRSGNGLPFLPGRTVKGLMREGMTLAEECGQVEAETTGKLFGDQGRGEGDRFGTIPGKLFFSSATLGEQMEAWAALENNQRLTQQLFRELSMTALDDKGLAKDKSLRRIEVAVPVVLKARVCAGADAPEGWLQALKVAATLVRRLGSHRSRGFGRVAVSVEEGRG